MAESAWRTSSACASGACVQVQILPGCVRVRHSAEPGVWVEYTREEWAAHLDGVRAGEFDLPGDAPPPSRVDGLGPGPKPDDDALKPTDDDMIAWARTVLDQTAPDATVAREVAMWLRWDADRTAAQLRDVRALADMWTEVNEPAGESLRQVLDGVAAASARVSLDDLFVPTAAVNERRVIAAARAWKAKRDALGWPKPSEPGRYRGTSAIQEAAELWEAVASLDASTEEARRG